MTSQSNIVLAWFTVTAMLCHDDCASAMKERRNGLSAVPEKSNWPTTVPAPGTVTPGTGLQQLPDSPLPQSPASHKADASDLRPPELPDSLQLESMGSEGPLTSDHASDQVETPDPPVLSDTVAHTPSTHDVAAWIQALEATPELASITMDEIRQAQAADDSLQPVIQALKDRVQPPYRGLRQHIPGVRGCAWYGYDSPHLAALLLVGSWCTVQVTSPTEGNQSQ